MANWVEAAALGAILNGMIAGTALTAAIWVWLRLTPRSNATTRCALWLATLAAVACLPLWIGQAAPAAASLGASQAAPLTLPAPGGWLAWAFAAWAAVSALLLVRILYATAALRALKRRARPIGGAWAEQFDAMRARYGGWRTVRLGVSAEVHSPLAAGLFNPVILVPEPLPGRLSEQEFRQVLVHELAHIRRWDDWTCLAQKLVEAVLFFHPAVLWIGRRLNLEREIACDDWVVSMTGAPRPYAACLTKLIEFGRFSRTPQLAPGAVTRQRQISHRIESLLSPRRAASPRCSVAGALAGAGALAVGLMLGAHAAPVSVAGPALAALPISVASIPAAQIAYTAPPRTAPRANRPAPARSLAAARRPAQLLLVQEVTFLQSRDLTATYCIFYFGKAAQAGERAPVERWLAVFWTLGPPVRALPGRT